MADGYICRRGGTNVLNFLVVGGTSKPTTAKSNTIWANTSATVTSYHIGPLQPTGSAGMVWIRSGSASNYKSFNALKKNAVMIYVMSAQQYISGKWVMLDAHIYQSGAWTQFSTTTQYLFKAGDVMTDITGGWAAIDGASLLSNALDLVVYQDVKGAQVYTKNKIDLTNYKTLHVKVGATYHDSFMCGVMANAPTTTSGSYSTNSAKCAATKTLNAANTEFTLDVSSLSGSYYVWLGESGISSAANAGGYVTDVRLT